jgi:hypothetical protein
VLQRAGWALPTPCYMYALIKKEITTEEYDLLGYNAV